ncbi:MAG: glycosyltransferase [Actinomycetota bacterium]|nr:glycosyltransferase [Actinomycetota bacterium]
MLLSAALIARDEERFLGSCLRSLEGLVDEIVVVDTGSGDRTPEIARGAGARVYQRSWTDDFSAARNQALDLARGEWILYIDADERVRAGTADGLRAQLGNPAYIGHRVLLHPRPGHSPYWELRLFRNDPALRFRGIIHENIWPAIESRRAATGGLIGQTKLVMDHEGYEGDQHRKHLRNLPLLERSLAQDPSRVFSWCHLATIRGALGDEAGAARAWEEAIRLVTGRAVRQPEDAIPFLHLIEKGLAAGEDVTARLDQAQLLFPSNLQFVWLQAQALMAAGRDDEAIGYLQRLAGADQATGLDMSWAYDRRLFGVFAYDLLAVCHSRGGQFAAARRYYELAAGCEPANVEWRAKAAACARLCRSG